MSYRMLLAGLVAMLGLAQLAPAEDTILEMGAKDWKYWDGGDKLPENWNSPEFDDSAWKSGQAPLGYGDDDIKQEISFGGDEANKHLVALFRRTVDVESLEGVKKVLGQFYCDDACIIYVNGEEVHRFNLKDGEVTEKTWSEITVAGELERYTLSFLVDADKFKVGKNVLAVRVHQRGPVSSDMAINVSLKSLTDDKAVEEAESLVKEEAESLKAIAEENF